MEVQKKEAVVQLSTLLDLANLLSEDQKNFLIQNLIKQKNTKKTIHLPLSIFSKELSCLESICKYLRDELNLSFNEMSSILNRKPITLRTSYNKAQKKQPKYLVNIDFQFNIPTQLLSNRKYTTFEVIILYLKDTKKLKISQIAELLNRNYKTIWTTYSRAKKK